MVIIHLGSLIVCIFFYGTIHLWRPHGRGLVGFEICDMFMDSIAFKQ